MRGVTELEQLLAELAADADEAIEHEALAEAARQRIRAKLPRARELGAGPAQLERTVKSLFVERSIRRWTSDHTPQPDVERPKRKRPGAAPDGS